MASVATINRASADTSPQRLSTLLKTTRRTLRRDKGLNGDLDRLPLLTWIMFLKFLDDMESLHEAEAELESRPYDPIIAAPYRWRDWAATPGGLTGDELLDFINNDVAKRADGSEGPGLFQYLRLLSSRDDVGQREIIATVFRGVQNRMVSGYLFRDVVDKINEIHFNASNEVHTLSHIYESMLREMRDAAGDSGEFYTPRPVIDFMVAVTEPKLGEVVLDPACGTGGFLAASFTLLRKTCRTVDDVATLQNDTLIGQEAKPLPYMLGQLNLLLHGMESPTIVYGNTLSQKLAEIGDDARVDVILTNPPFGGEEEPGIEGNFPADKRTKETASLFLQYIMRKLRRGSKWGRAAVVVPDGTLFGDGVVARIKAELLAEFNLHTIVRLGDGVFAPYADIATNILFFDRSAPTDKIWFYQVPVPGGRRKYSKTKAFQYEEFGDCLAWWNDRQPTRWAWTVDASTLVKRDSGGRLISCNLDVKNPNNDDELDYMSPADLIKSMLQRQRDILKLFEEMQTEVTNAAM